MSGVKPIEEAVLDGYGIRLEPLRHKHIDGLRAAAGDGDLGKLWYTVVPSAGEVERYVEQALEGFKNGTMLPWAVIDGRTGNVMGSTRYHDILKDVERVEIGYTWYAARMHGTHLNPVCKLLLMTHAFETLGCAVVGFRTDNFNFRSQRAIERLGAKKDGIIRHHQRRKDGSVRDSVMYSILANEWPDVKRNLLFRLSTLAR
ncbi:MAG: GNAT family N-acetyltransferase [Candidatus Eremiobacteraeota bacterium]|nr:GNAT family N-acetyltransferase [Candidatus Eremiobacteraeota bacterium]